MKKDQESLPSFGIQPEAWQPWQALQERLDALQDAEQDPPCRGADGHLWTSESAAERREAAALCDDCTIRALCLNFALANDERFCVFAGFDFKYPAQRRAARTEHERSTP